MATSKIKIVNFISKMFKANYTIQPHAWITINGNELGMTNISGYIQLATLSFFPGTLAVHAGVVVESIGFGTGDDPIVVLYNPSDNVISDTFQTRIAFVKSDHLKYIPYGS